MKNVPEEIVIVVLIMIVALFLRNLYNLIQKRRYRNKTLQTEKSLNHNREILRTCREKLEEIPGLKKEINLKINLLKNREQQINEYKKKYDEGLSQKEREIEKQKETISHQQRVYEKYVNYKNVELNNSRLSAHFIKNVISQIYLDIEETDSNYTDFLGISFKKNKNIQKVPPLKALKNIFKLLDYNVSALNINEVSMNEELIHVEMFLELISYLKPKTQTKFENMLGNKQIENLRIKPTLFFPFLENALKHGSLNQNDSYINIKLSNHKNQLKYCIVNSAKNVSSDKNLESSSNFGLNALQALIDVYYSGSSIKHHTLPNNTYLSELTLNISQ